MSKAHHPKEIAICESKIKYKNVIAAKYVIETNHQDLSQDYYKCKVCSDYHLFTINFKVNQKRFRAQRDKNFKDDLQNRRKKGRSRRKGKR